MADTMTVQTLSKTKHRIVQGAIAAFNQSSFAEVTTAALAARLGMSEGNLWYHYPTKADLLAAVQQAFLADWTQVSEDIPASPDPIADYIAYMHRWQALFDSYLFMFRDRSEYGAHSPELAANLSRIYSAVSVRLRTLYNALIAANLLTIPAEAVDDLITNVMIISRFTLEFRQEAQPGLATPPAAGLAQHLSLLKPYLDPGSFRRVQAGLNGY